MNPIPAPPQDPAGPFEAPGPYDAAKRDGLLQVLEDAPSQLRAAVAGLSDEQLDTKYKNWTIRQIAHHLADSNIHAYVRTKLAATETRPTISPFDETEWSALADSAQGPVEPSLVLLEGLQPRWVAFFRALSETDWSRTFYHPATQEDVSIWQGFNYFAWHARHHTAQILWLRQQHGW